MNVNCTNFQRISRLYLQAGLAILFLLSISVQGIAHEFKWKELAADGSGDHSGSLPDAEKLFWDYDAKGDTLWFRFEVFGDLPTGAFGLNLVCRIPGRHTSNNWWGSNGVSYNRLVTVWVTGTPPSSYSGTIGIADAAGVNANNFRSLKSNNIAITADAKKDDVIIGFPRRDLLPDKEITGSSMSINIIGAVGSNEFWSDDIPNSGNPAITLRFPFCSVKAPDVELFEEVRDRIDFGSSLIKQYSVANEDISTESVKVHPTVEGEGAAAYRVFPAGPIELAPGESQNFDVIFLPDRHGLRAARLDLGLAAAEEGAVCFGSLPEAEIQLNGSGLGLAGQVEEDIDFGDVGINALARKRVVLFRNEASVTYRYRIALGGASDFKLAGASGAPPIVQGLVDPGATAAVDLEFSPRDEGLRNAELHYSFQTLNGKHESSLTTIALAGTGLRGRLKFRAANAVGHIANQSTAALNIDASAGDEEAVVDFVLSNTGLAAINVSAFRMMQLDLDNPVDGRLRVRWSAGFGNGTPLPAESFRLQRRVGGGYQNIDSDERFSLPPSAELQLRIVFAPQQAGMHFARLLFLSDAFLEDNLNTVLGRNENDEPVPGLFSYDFNRFNARSALLQMPRSLQFPPTPVGSFSEQTVTVSNQGDARLLIRPDDVRMMITDRDFTLEAVLPEAISSGNGRLVIPVGGSATLTVRFTPRKEGVRISTLRLASNDLSDQSGPAGERFLALGGQGIAGAEIRLSIQGGGNDINADTAIVDAPATYQERRLSIRNPGTTELNISEVSIVGADKDDFRIIATPANSVLSPGAETDFRVSFQPQSGGPKNAQLEILNNAEFQSVTLRGFGGLRTLATEVNNLFDGDTTRAGSALERNVTIRNTGNVPLRIFADPVINGDYSSITEDVDIAPGAEAAIAIRLNSVERGSKNGTILLANNSTNQADLTISLFGFVGIEAYSVTPAQFALRAHVVGGELQIVEECIEFTNDGDFPIRINALDFIGADSDRFSLLAAWDPGDEILPGQMRRICFRFTPEDSSPVNAQLRITTTSAPATTTIDLTATVTDVTGELNVDAGLSLEQVFPNPAAAYSTLQFALQKPAHVTLVLYSAQGEEVLVLLRNVLLAAGDHELRFQTPTLAAGTYYCRLSTAGHSSTRSLTIAR